MPPDEANPTFLSMWSAKGRPRPGRSRAGKLKFTSSPQLAFALEPEPVSPPVAPPLPAAIAPPLPAAVPPAPREPILYTVRQLLSEVRQHVELAYSGILSVEGEISNFRAAASGHIYFTLKDGDAQGGSQLPVVLFRRQSTLLGFKPRDGLSVEVRGRISVYESRGQLQFIAETMRPRGEGALQLAFEQLKRRLAAEGLFEAARKRALPPFPHCIGIVTSPRGAALRDIIQVVRRRHARLNLLIYPATVQGPGCPGSVAAGVRWFNRHPERVQIILIARGGGSFEDLAGFNDEALARAIFASDLPVVSAVGHEIDSTIADFVADLRAPTPSAAAELITAAQHRIGERVLALERRVHRAGQFHLMHARQRLSQLSAEHVLARLRDAISLRQQRVDELRFRLTAALVAREGRRSAANRARLAALETRLHRQDPTIRLAQSKNRLEAASARIAQAAHTVVARRRSRLERASARLHALSPLAVLNRGYAIVYNEAGAIVRSPAEAAPGRQIRARLAMGSLLAQVLPETPETEKLPQ